MPSINDIFAFFFEKVKTNMYVDLMQFCRFDVFFRSYTIIAILLTIGTLMISSCEHLKLNILTRLFAFSSTLIPQEFVAAVSFKDDPLDFGYKYSGLGLKAE